MEILEKIGLTKKEAEIYKVLLSLGETKVSALQKELRAHPQIVYRALQSLKEKGLVSMSKKQNVLHAIAETPKELVRFEKSKLEELQALLPDLLALQKSPSTSIVQIAKGDSALRIFREKGYAALKKGEVFYVIGGSGDRFYAAMGERYREVEEKRIRKQVRKKVISIESERMKFESDTLKANAEFRFLSDELPVISSTNIYNDVVGIVIWAEEPVIITIKSYEVAKSYKAYFNQLWSVAK